MDTTFDVDDLRAMLKELVKSEFNRACAAFFQNQDGHNWARLENSMWALQGVKFLDDEQVRDMRGLNIVEAHRCIADTHRGKNTHRGKKVTQA